MYTASQLHIQLSLCLKFAVPDSQKLKVLKWKFDTYDTTKDGAVQQTELFNFFVDIFDFLRCDTFSDHVNKLMDVNNDTHITEQEWIHFFTKDIAGKHSVKHTETA